MEINYKKTIYKGVTEDQVNYKKITYKLDEKQENCTFFIEFNDEDNNVVRQDKVTIL